MSTDRSLERWVLLQDVAVLVLSFGLAEVVRNLLQSRVPGLKPAVPPASYAALLLAFVPMWVWCAERLELQRVRTLNGPALKLMRALLGTQAWGLVGIALLLTITQTQLNRSLIALFGVFSTVLLIVLKRVQRRWVVRERGAAVALVLGDLEEVVAQEMAGYRGRAVERLHDPDALRDRLRAGGVDEVVVGDLPPPVLARVIDTCDESGLPVLVRLAGPDLGRLSPRIEVAGTTAYLSCAPVEPDPAALVLKAILDRVVAGAAFVLSLPLFLAVALAVKLTSRGPVLFVQERGGLNGRPFPMLKFRSMREGAEAEREMLLSTNEMDGPVFKMERDPRVTPIGAWLRRTSLDELPQLLNVLAGQMSIVGPRPLPLVETRGLTGPHRRRLSVRPGLTCLWQVKGRSSLTFAEWMTLDLQYIDNWSLGLDLLIVLRTIPALIVGRGAR